MITSSDSHFSYDAGKFFIILPSNDKKILTKIKKLYNIKKVKENFSYNSGSNKKFLNVDEIRKLIKKNIDNKFKPN